MQLREATAKVFDQLKDIVSRLSVQHYCMPQVVLSGSSVGQHIRHILEFYQCLEKGYNIEKVNYDLRERNQILEQYPEIAIESLDHFLCFMKKCDPEKRIRLCFSYSSESDKPNEITTTVERELLYNLEHSIHHMAIIKIGILQLQPDFTFPENFGVASSTVRHQQESVRLKA